MKSWPYPRVVAHRGGGALAPENTLGAIRKGHALGFRAVEFDVMLSADKVPLLIHDETLERTTNGHGTVATTPYAELARLDAGSWHSAEHRNERLPRFEAAAQLCISLGLAANVEIKPAAGFERETGRVVAETAHTLWRDAATQPLLSSFSTEALQSAREAAPVLPRGLLFGKIPGDWQAQLEQLDCLSLHCDYHYLTQEQAKIIKNAGYRLLVYTVNDMVSARQVLDWGVDTIVTDHLDIISENTIYK